MLDGAEKLALVLSGGGARGAYEAGALAYFADEHPEVLERVRIITGSSVGAVNGVFLASRGLTPQSVHDLVGLWKSLVIDDVLGVSSIDMIKIFGAAPLRLMSRSVRSPSVGLLDGSGLWRLIAKQVYWGELHRHVRTGRFDAVAILGTDIQSGKTHVFTEAADPKLPLPSTSDVELIPTELARPHVLASAAIPLLFPPIRVRGRWYMDGGVRNNTPFSTALRLGADALLVVDLHASKNVPLPTDEFPGIGQIVGKLLDAIFLDRVAYDLDRLTRINDVVQAAEDAGVLPQVLAKLEQRGRPRYRYVPHFVVKPTVDLGRVAAEHVRLNRGRWSFIRVLDALFEDDANTSGDAASFLFFDGSFATTLIDAGRKDAEALYAQRR